MSHETSSVSVHAQPKRSVALIYNDADGDPMLRLAMLNDRELAEAEEILNRPMSRLPAFKMNISASKRLLIGDTEVILILPTKLAKEELGETHKLTTRATAPAITAITESGQALPLLDTEE